MTSNKNPYETPSSNLEKNKEKMSAIFSTLNFWRKFYLVFIWLITLLYFAVIIFGIKEGVVESEIGGISIWNSIILLIIPGITLWTHYAVIRRSSRQVIVLAVLNIFPFANIIGCLIMFSILRVTKKEREQFELVKA